MLPTDHEHLLWLYERGRILNHAPPADEDLGDPADFEPIYLSILEQVAEQADSDQDRLSALFLLAQYRGYDSSLKDRLFQLTDISKSERVKLTALHLLGCAIGLFKRIIRIPRSFAPRAPSIPLPTPRAPRAPSLPVPALPWPRLPYPRRRARKQPKPAAKPQAQTPATPAEPPPLPISVPPIPVEDLFPAPAAVPTAASLPLSPAAAGVFPPSPPIAAEDPFPSPPIAAEDHFPSPPIAAEGHFPSPPIAAGDRSLSPPILGGDTEGGALSLRRLAPRIANLTHQPKPNRRERRRNQRKQRRKRRRAPPQPAVA